MIRNSVDNKSVKRDPEQDAVGLHGDGRVVAGLGSLCAVTVLLFAGFLLAGPAANAEAPQASGRLRTLTTARQAHDLSSQEAKRGYPVHLRAVVTFYDPKAPNKRLGMTVHDATGSVFLRLDLGFSESLPTGTLVDLHGVSALGEFAPIVDHPQFKVIGYVGFPEDAPHPSFSHMLAGADDGQWVEVEGIVHSVTDYGHYEMLQLAMADGTIAIKLIKDEGYPYSSLVDAKLRIRGNAQPIFNVSRQHMIGVRVECPRFSQVHIVEPAPEDPFKLPTILISRLLQWDMVSLLAHRVHVQGRVTLQWPGSSVCIRDATQGICAQTELNTPLVNGELIDLAGFARAEGNAPVLTDAVFKSAGGATVAPVTAVPVTAEQALLGNHESQLIQIDGQLVSRDPAATDTTLLLTSGTRLFTAILPQNLGGPETKAWENGSVLRIKGICSVQIDAQRTGVGLAEVPPQTFRVLMRSPADVVVVRKPSWWTPAHLVILLALALCGTLLVLGWVVVLRRRVERQTTLLRESEQRFRHMALHDALTGLATRLLLEDRLNAAVEIARRRQAGLGLLMLDLDKFKETNDTFGHPAGDEVLRVTADRLLEVVRKSDTVARMGGDEFVVLLPDLRDPQIAERIAANIVKTLADPITFKGRVMPVSVSVGVCSAFAGDMDADTLLKNVDAALYRAKAHGRNCFVVFSSDLAGAQMNQAS
jgi:diguanylate cyclase (GGDEF)-like protein